MKHTWIAFLLLAIASTAVSQTVYTSMDKYKFSVLDSAYRGSVASGAAASAITYNSADFTTDNHRGIRLTINVIDTQKVKSVPPYVRFALQGKDYFGNYYTLVGFDTVKTEGILSFTLHPEATTAASLLQKDWIPKLWRLQSVVYDSGYINYSVSGELIR